MAGITGRVCEAIATNVRAKATMEIGKVAQSDKSILAHGFRIITSPYWAAGQTDRKQYSVKHRKCVQQCRDVYK